MTGPRIGVVIVTYRSERVVGACLSSLIEHLASDAPIVVVDNASTDGTKEVVRRFAPRVRLIEGERNVGFGAANNLGAGPDGLGSAVDWILLVNPDVILTHFDAELFARDAECGSDGQVAFVTTSTGRSTEAIRGLPSSLERSWRYTFGLLRPARFPSWQRRRRPQAGAWAPGSFCAVRRSAWDAVGGFDDRFFLYYEDVDLSRRLTAAGYGIKTSRAATGHHALGSGAHGVRDAERLALSIAGWLTYERKWGGDDRARTLLRLLRVDLGLVGAALRPFENTVPAVRRKASTVRDLRAILRREARSLPGPSEGTGRPANVADGPFTTLPRATVAHGDSESRPVTFVLWNGSQGGAQTHTVALSCALRLRGYPVSLVIVGSKGAVGAQAEQASFAVTALGMDHGLAVIRHPLLFSRAVRRTRPAVCVLPNSGVLTVVLRGLGFRGTIVGMEHGISLNRAGLGVLRRACDRVARAVAAPLTDCEIAVSEVAAAGLAAVPHARRVVVVRNGIDTGRFRPRPGSVVEPTVVIGVACRLVAGKGVELVLRAAKKAAERLPGRFVIVVAGDGPERARLVDLSTGLGLRDLVRFSGFVADMPGFWNAVDVGVFVSSGWVESFGLSAAEALACGCRIVSGSTRATTELLDGCPSARLVEDAGAAHLGAALCDEVRAGKQSLDDRLAIHEWTTTRFSMADTAAAYERVFSSLPRAAAERAPR